MTVPLRIGVIPGDGVGPEVVRQGLKTLEAAARRYGFRYDLVAYPWSSEHYLRTGELMPESMLDEYRALDALYLGALGDPRVEPGLVERSVIMAIRLGLDLYVNVRPIVLYAAHLSPLKDVGPEDIDMVVVRENTEDAYVGVGGILRRGTPEEIAVAEMIYTRRGVERAIRYAFDLARARKSAATTRARVGKVTLVDKSNAIRAQDIWRRTFSAVARDYPDIETDAVYVDAAAVYMVVEPARFDVVVTTNLFGDIITDLGAAIQGGMGSAASGNIHPGQVSMFEPIHGSAPDIAGQNTASPIGAIAAMALLLRHVGEERAADAIEGAIRSLLQTRRIPTLDTRSGLSTDQIGDLICDSIEHEGQFDPGSSVQEGGV